MMYFAKFIVLILAVKAIVQVGTPFFADPDSVHTQNPSGTQVCVRLVIAPFNSVDTAAVTECGARTALVASTSCQAIKNLVIARAALPPFNASVTSEEILVHACTN